MSNFDLAVRFLLQLVVILSACKAVSFVGTRWFGQTKVVCEMIAGVLLGPTLFGLVAPKLQTWIFPTENIVFDNGTSMPNPSMSILFAVAQIGLILYMFIVGLEFNFDAVRKSKAASGTISLAGIVTPLALGGLVGFWLTTDEVFFTRETTRWGAALFLGAAICITAFPMLARILHEAGLAKTHVGTLALAAGSIDDAVAWCLLAVVVSSIQGDPTVALLAAGGTVVYVTTLLTVARRPLRQFVTSTETKIDTTGSLPNSALTTILVIIFVCAWFTDFTGVYAVFGAFLLGAVLPSGKFAQTFDQQVGPIVSTLLLPIFFAYSGLNTQLGLVSSPRLWLTTFVIIAVAIVGKAVACAIAARATGQSKEDSLLIGTLMNARGLMELIILNVGLEAGIITPTLFTILAMMAVVTTLMTSPLVKWQLRHHRSPTVVAAVDG